MTQDQLDRLVADATGEDLCEIEHLGFSLVHDDDHDFDPEPWPESVPFVIDFDDLDLQRNTSLFQQHRSDRRAA